MRAGELLSGRSANAGAGGNVHGHECACARRVRKKSTSSFMGNPLNPITWLALRARSDAAAAYKLIADRTHSCGMRFHGGGLTVRSRVDDGEFRERLWGGSGEAEESKGLILAANQSRNRTDALSLVYAF